MLTKLGKTRHYGPTANVLTRSRRDFCNRMSGVEDKIFCSRRDRARFKLIAKTSLDCTLSMISCVILKTLKISYLDEYLGILHSVESLYTECEPSSLGISKFVIRLN